MNLANNPSLTHLDCNTNSIKSLDLKKKPGLVLLYCYANQLSSLDVSDNPKLANLYCHTNKLSFATLPMIKSSYTNYSYSPQAELEIVDISRKIDLSSQANLTDKDGTKHQTEFKWYKKTEGAAGFYNANEGDEYDLEAPGVFAFAVYDDIQVVLGVMKNGAFPKLTLITTERVLCKNVVGINNAEATEIHCYPNPMTDVLHITTPTTETPLVKIYNLSGKLMINEQSNQVDVSHLISGIYVVEVNGQKMKAIKR